ncbi:MAG: hypothetical protein KTR24_05925 [Saprospiraceae bacterium]|nr:hypothetical protein [Saprospiraceae bacterium]
MPAHVKVDELNWGPVAVVQMLEAEIPSFDRVIIVCAIERSHRSIGDISVFKWLGGLPETAQIQACVGDAATGVISVENLLVIGEYFNVWNDEVYLVDVEPGPEIAGEDLTPAVQKKIPTVLALVKQLALGDLTDDLQIEPLFGDRIFQTSMEV